MNITARVVFRRFIHCNGKIKQQKKRKQQTQTSKTKNLQKMARIFMKDNISEIFHHAVENMTQTDLAVTFMRKDNNFAFLNEAEIHQQFRMFVSFSLFFHL